MVGSNVTVNPQATVPTSLPLGVLDLRTSVGTRAYVDLQNPVGVSGNFSAGLQAELNLGGAAVTRASIPREEWSNVNWQPSQTQTRYRLHLMAGYQVFGVPFGMANRGPNFNNVLSVGIGFQFARYTGINPRQIYSTYAQYLDPTGSRHINPEWASTFRFVASYNHEGNLHGILSAEYRQQFRPTNSHWGFDGLLGLDVYLRQGLPALGAHAELGVAYYF